MTLSFSRRILHIGYPYCTEKSSDSFQNRKFFCRSVVHISNTCLLLGFSFLIIYEKTWAVEFSYFHAHYCIKGNPFFWMGCVYIMYQFRVDKGIMVTVNTKQNPVCYHIDSFFLFQDVLKEMCFQSLKMIAACTIAQSVI